MLQGDGSPPQHGLRDGEPLREPCCLTTDALFLYLTDMPPRADSFGWETDRGAKDGASPRAGPVLVNSSCFHGTAVSLARQGHLSPG